MLHHRKYESRDASSKPCALFASLRRWNKNCGEMSAIASVSRIAVSALSAVFAKTPCIRTARSSSGSVTGRRKARVKKRSSTARV